MRVYVCVWALNREEILVLQIHVDILVYSWYLTCKYVHVLVSHKDAHTCTREIIHTPDIHTCPIHASMYACIYARK
jgi:hypothetical protein